MDINQVKFGSYSIGNGSFGTNNKNDKPEQVQQPVANGEQVQSLNANEVYNAMHLMGLQNMSVISANPKEIDPSKYIDEKRVSEIEAMMAEFDAGVEQTASILDEEFPGMLTEVEKYALAASIYERA